MDKNFSSYLSISSLSWKVENKVVLDSINWEIKANENWVLLGKNGSGKTSLINFLFGYKWPTSGSIQVLGKTYGDYPLREIQKYIGILESSHQETRIQRQLTVRDILRTGLLNSIGLYSQTTKSQEEIIEKTLESNSWIYPEQNFDTLSSGEKRKVLLLRALIKKPRILILDEPTANLDIHAREDFFELLTEYHQKNEFVCILITHRIDEIPSFFTHAFLIHNGKTIYQGKIEEAFQEKYLSKTFGLNLEVYKKEKTYFLVVKGR